MANPANAANLANGSDRYIMPLRDDTKVLHLCTKHLHPCHAAPRQEDLSTFCHPARAHAVRRFTQNEHEVIHSQNYFFRSSGHKRKNTYDRRVYGTAIVPKNKTPGA